MRATAADPGGAEASTKDEAVAAALRGLFGRDSLYMFVWALQLLGAAALTPVMTRVVGVAEFGGVASANAVMQIAFVLAGLGLQTAVQRVYANNGIDDARRILTLGIIMACVIIAIIDVSGPFWSSRIGFDHYGGAVRLAVFWAGISAITNSGLGILRSEDRLAAFSSVSLLQSVVAEGLSLLLVIVAGPTAAMFILGQLLAQIIATGLAFCLVPPKLLRPTDRMLVFSSLAYALPLVPAVLSSFVLNASDRLIVQAELGLSAVARYQVSYNIGSMPLLLIGVLHTVWMPRIFALGADGSRSAVLSASRDALYKLLVPVVIGLSVGAPFTLRLWAPPTYDPDGLQLVTSIVIVSVIPFAAGVSASRALLSEGRTIGIAVANIVAAAANVGFNLVLVPRYELVGAAVATLFAYGLLSAILLFLSNTVVRLPRVPIICLARLVLAALVAGAAAAGPSDPGSMAIRALVAIGCLVWLGRDVRRLSVTPVCLRPEGQPL